MEKILDSSWNDGGTGGTIVINPLIDAVIADSGNVIGDGEFFFYVVLWASVAARFRLEHRNAGNSANVETAIVPIAAGSSAQQIVVPLKLAASERLRVAMLAAVTGDVTASIMQVKNRSNA